MSVQFRVSQKNFVRGNAISRESIRYIMTRFSRHRQSPTKKNIFLFSCRRSGSTWLGESLGAEPGLRFVNDPLRPKWMRREYLKTVELGPGDKFLDFDGLVGERVSRYLDNIKYTRLCSPYDPFKPSFHFKTDRILFKDLRVNPIIGHFLEQVHKYQFLWLMRHPVPTILSCFDMPRIDLMRYIESDSYREQHLSEDLINFLLRVREKGDQFELWAAEWALDQLVPWKLFSSEPNAGLRVSYEQLLAQPENIVRKLTDYLDLRRPDLITKALRIPSASTSAKRLTLIEKAGSNELLTAWKIKAAPETIARIFRVIERFGIDYYSPSGILPDERYLMASC